MSQKNPKPDTYVKPLDDLTPEVRRALLDAMLDRAPIRAFEELVEIPRPTLLPEPAEVSAFQVRVDLLSAKPPIWRRLVLPGDLTLEALHVVIQAAMGWTDTHLHRFRTEPGPRSPHFITQFDLSEGEDGVLENMVRFDQVVAQKGDALWYDYDFGDGWEHVLKVEAVLPGAGEKVSLVTGRRACPPEDSGGIWGYKELAAWVASDYDDALLPEHFENADHAREWLPLDWHPEEFDLESTRDAIASAMFE